MSAIEIIKEEISAVKNSPALKERMLPEKAINNFLDKINERNELFTSLENSLCQLVEKLRNVVPVITENDFSTFSDEAKITLRLLNTTYASLRRNNELYRCHKSKLKQLKEGIDDFKESIEDIGMSIELRNSDDYKKLTVGIAACV